MLDTGFCKRSKDTWKWYDPFTRTWKKHSIASEYGNKLGTAQFIYHDGPDGMFEFCIGVPSTAYKLSDGLMKKCWKNRVSNVTPSNIAWIVERGGGICIVHWEDKFSDLVYKTIVNYEDKVQFVEWGYDIMIVPRKPVTYNDGRMNHVDQ